jgi:flavorubredoxin
MYLTKEICDGVHWVGGSDRRLALFENVFPVPRGVSYNAYLVMGEKTVLLDTVDKSVRDVFFENLAFLLKGRKLDYVIINHVELDHCSCIEDLVLRYPDIKIIGNRKTIAMIQQFFTFDVESRAVEVKEGESLSVGDRHFTFVMAPMVHWPEVMASYESKSKILFSADAFGTFGAINGNIFADELDFETEWLPDARRYYTNIVGKYGASTQGLLKKAELLDIAFICPLHGPVWRKNLCWYIEKYQRWSTYTPEDAAVMIAYASIYGNTENAANILAFALADLGVKNIAMYDVSVTHPSVIVADAFRCSTLVFASPTYNAGLFCNMETLLLDLKAHNLQNRTVAIIENGSWAAQAGYAMANIFTAMKNITVLENTISLKSSVKAEQQAALLALAKSIAATLPV